ncbi:exodeoxyribonuclease V subunit alpha [Aquincola sp. MAHUQ-54]|uniref:RecBCD enzyme subunit RecD n=1 Tax=Aquincola agrisoli TaxID=3119538 RepID=A0AAW9QM96_9BURK
MTGASRFDDAAAEPSDALSEGLGLWLQRWSTEAGADARCARIAGQAGRAVSRATREGHVCIALADLPRYAGAAAADADETDAPGTEPLPSDPAELRRALMASGVAGTAAQPGAHPLVLDDEGRLYLHRYFDYERRLATRLARAAQAALAPPSAEAAARLRERFAGNAAALGGRADWQLIAAGLALRGRLAVVSGGPGTGKTTMVVNLLASLLAESPDCRIALAAPTGKAAARMTEALRQRAAHLPVPLREKLPAQSYTIHRLLGVTPGGFAHDAAHPLPIDALVVDEASMLDLALATQLLEAVPEHARIVLLGDKDQLAAVESGAVFAELSADPTLSDQARRDLAALCGLPAEAIVPPPAAQPSALHDSAVWLTQNFRFAADSAIGRLAREINAGDAKAVRQRLAKAAGDAARQPSLFGDDGGGEPAAATAATAPGEAADDALRWIPDAGTQPGAATLAAGFDGFAAYAQAVRQAPHDVAAATAAFERFRVLCALREGPRGLLAINEHLARRLRPADAPPGPWYAGRPVMVLRNDPLRRLFNGDVGLVLPDAEGALQAWFPDAAAPGGFRAVHPARLPPHETAYAMTVHKSQGSEFEAVLMVMPAGVHRVVTRELLYTAVTRAKARVVIAGGAEGVAAAVGARTRRASGLLARVGEVLGG